MMPSQSHSTSLDGVDSSEETQSPSLRHGKVSGADQVARIVDLSIECKFGSSCLGQCSTSSNHSENTLSQTEEGSRTLLTVAESLHAQGRREECLEILSKVLARQYDNEEALYLQAVCYIDGGEHAMAVGCLAGALSTSPGHVPSLVRYALIQKDLKQYKNALEMIEKAYECMCKLTAMLEFISEYITNTDDLEFTNEAYAAGYEGGKVVITGENEDGEAYTSVAKF